MLPIPIVGTFSGALVGGLIGSKVSKKVGGIILEKFDTTTYPQDRTELGEELERLSKLKEDGIINEEEFRAAKAKNLGL